MGLILFFSLTVFFILYIASKGKYNDYINPLEKSEYRLKEYLSIGFFVMDKIGYKYKTLYDQNLRIKTSGLYGTKYADFFLWVHWANKVTAMFVGVLLFAIIGVGWGEFSVEFIIFLFVFLVFLFFALDKELENRIKNRKFLMQKDFPDFLNKLILLMNAGMTVTAAWDRIVSENKKNSIFYFEAKIAIEEIKNGKSEVEAFEDFARSCRVSQITKFVSILIQNLRKGNSQFVCTLSEMTSECWQLRKHIARRLGEKASTKLLFPMIFNFLIIVVIVAMPALMAMSI